MVELPRESPEQALKLFGGLANLRMLVIGGDGTVAWLLSCIDRMNVRTVFAQVFATVGWQIGAGLAHWFA